MVRYISASIVVAVLLAACGGSAASDRTDPVVVDSDVGELVGSPLESALGFVSEPERRQYQLISMQRDADTSMVQCMKQAGFFYAARPSDDSFRAAVFVGDGSREWASINGLGITSSFIDALATGAAQATPDAAAVNLDYVALLTAEQAVSYDRALVGELVADISTTEYQPAGCWGQAYPEFLRLLALLEEFDSELRSLNSRLDSDPRVLGFQATWSTCMQSSGLSYVDDTAMVDDLYARLLTIELVENDGQTQVVSGEALEDLAAYELDVAVASFDCRVGFAVELSRLRYDYEQEFLDDNRFRIAELEQPSP